MIPQNDVNKVKKLKNIIKENITFEDYDKKITDLMLKSVDRAAKMLKEDKNLISSEFGLRMYLGGILLFFKMDIEKEILKEDCLPKDE